MKPLPQYFNLLQPISVVLQLTNNLNKFVDGIVVPLDHLPQSDSLMQLDQSLPLHLQHFDLHLADVLNMLQHLLVSIIHQLANLLEVFTDLLEEPSPLLLPLHLRHQLGQGQPRITHNQLWCTSCLIASLSHTISAPSPSQNVSLPSSDCCGSLDEPN